MSWEFYSHFEARGVMPASLESPCLGPMRFPNVRAQDRVYQFGLVGDTGYTTEDIEGFKGLLAAVNRADLPFVVHVGDFENDGRAYTRNPSVGPMPCTDESFKAVYDPFNPSGIRSF